MSLYPRVPARSGPCPPRARRRFLAASAGAVLSTALVLGAAHPASAAVPIYVGAVGEVQQLSSQAGAPLAVHAYSHFHKAVPQGRMLTVRAEESWRQVAAARAGSALYADIVRWARTIKSRPGPVMVAYHHEPEAAGSSRYGSAQDFIAAYRRVVSIFRAEGAANVRFTWQMTDWAFRTSPSDARYAARWYPGDAYVDDVGADVFNWFDCGEGQGRWMALATLMDPVLAFARAHRKSASLPEFGADPDPRRAKWLADARNYFVANRDTVSAVFYFNRGPTNPANSDCSWTLTQRSEHAAYGAMASDRRYFSA